MLAQLPPGSLVAFNRFARHAEPIDSNLFARFNSKKNAAPRFSPRQGRPAASTTAGLGSRSEGEREGKGREGQGRGKNNFSNSRGSSLANDWEEFGTPTGAPAWSINDPKVFYFAVANAYSLMDGGALLEEVLHDGISRAQRGGRPKDVWLVIEPAFLEHKSLSFIRARIQSPTAAIVSTNVDWMLSTVRELLPQATIGKFYAPTAAIPNPFKSNLKPGDAVIGGGGIWH